MLIISLIGTSAVILVIATIFSLLFTNTLIKPIKRISAALADIAQGDGDLTVRLPVTGNDEITDMSEYFNETIEKIEGKKPKIITTSAKIFPNTVGYADLGREIVEDDTPYLILFGTGWGLTSEIMDLSYKILEPIRGKTQYNHLCVRSAVSIVLDRLLGEN